MSQVNLSEQFADDRLGELIKALTCNGPNTAVDLAQVLGQACGTLDEAYLVCLGRRADADAAIALRDLESVTVCRHLLASDEFRETIAARIVKHYSRMPTAVFVHVPKTAGTTITSALCEKPEWLVWKTGFQDAAVTRLDDLLRELADVEKRITAGGVECLWLTGHFPLTWAEAYGLIAKAQQTFAILRDPVDLVVSQASYMARQISTKPLLPESLLWSSWLARGEPDPTLTTKTAAIKLMRTEEFAANYGNTMCRYLGGSPDAASAMDAVERTNISLAGMRAVGPILEELGVPRRRLNVTPSEDKPDLRAAGDPAERSADLLRMACALADQDILLHTWLEKSGRLQDSSPLR